MIDLYCERADPGLWAEPFNALSNVAFLLAALAASMTIRRSGSARADLVVMVGIMVAIGLGSALFHTMAATWARVLDVVPILLFQLGVVWLYARNIMALDRRYAAGLVAVFLAAALGARQFPGTLSGSLAYAPALLVLTGFGTYHYLRAERERWTLVAASALFLVSLTFRSADLVVCTTFPVGTHFSGIC